MKVYLAGTQGDKGGLTSGNKDLYLLESFYYLKDKHMEMYANHHFLLDSGAFTFMNQNNDIANVDWDEYVERYASFINKHDIDLFFELDIDDLVGIERVEELRHKLESITNKKCIPVWHKSRGKDYWFRMIKEYDYVALGGMVSNVAYKDKVEKMFPWFINTAYKENCKVHGLGYTSVKGLKKYKFYSVDSTSWIAGQKFMQMVQYLGNGEFKTFKPKDGQRGINPKKRLRHNFHEWVKFQKYALNNL